MRKLSPEVKAHLLPKVKELGSEPTKGEPLKGVYKFLRSLHTTCEGTHYRVIYEVVPLKKEIYVHYVGSRENLYKQLVQLRLKPVGK
jgi:mRNA-degrading endonuclease RelE of RelBE toxin-antitoxin system